MGPEAHLAASLGSGCAGTVTAGLDSRGRAASLMVSCSRLCSQLPHWQANMIWVPPRRTGPPRTVTRRDCAPWPFAGLLSLNR